MPVITGYKGRVLLTQARLPLGCFRWSFQLGVQEYDVTCAGVGIAGAHRYTFGLESGQIELELYWRGDDEPFFNDEQFAAPVPGTAWEHLLLLPDKDAANRAWYWEAGVWLSVEAQQNVRDVPCWKVRGLTTSLCGYPSTTNPDPNIP